MSFLLPLMLVGLVAAAVPVVIHLFYRRRARRVKWGAMQFLGEVAAPAGTMGRWRVWVLMACRVGVVGAAAVALAWPRVTAKIAPAAWRAGVPVNVGVVIDGSVGQERISDGESGFERSIELAGQVLAGLRPEDSAAVVVAGSRPRVVGKGLVRGEDAGAVAELRRALGEERVRGVGGSIAEAVGEAEKVLADARGGKKVIVVLGAGDQKSWRPRDPGAWAAVSRGGRTGRETSFYAVEFPRAAEFGDEAVGNLRAEPGVIGGSQPVTVRGTVWNLGTRATGATTVRLFVDEKEVESRAVAGLGVKGEAEVEFSIPQGIGEKGSHRLRVALDARDSMAADKQVYGVVDVVEGIPILVVDGAYSSAGDSGGSAFLEAALRPDARSVLEPRVVTLGELASVRLTDFAVVIFNDCPTIPAAVRDDLIGYVRGGHGVWFVLGARSGAEFVRDNLVNSGLFPCEPGEARSAAGAGVGAVVKDPSHAVVSTLIAEGSDPFAGAFVRRWHGVKPIDPGTRVVVATDSGEPLVMERAYGGGGSVMVWTTGADGTWNNWNLMPNFVPLVMESALHLAVGAGERRGVALRVGEPIEYSAPAEREFSVATLTGPGGTTVSKAGRAVDGRVVATFGDTDEAGFYALKAGDASRYYAANVEPRELLPTPLSAEDWPWLEETQKVEVVKAADLGRVVRPRAEQMDAWTVLGVVLLALMVGESGVAYLIARTANAGEVAKRTEKERELEAVAV